jgi:hypothetical protein
MSTERESDDLPEQAEALLEGWPAPSRSALEWEELANATVAKIRETSIGSTDDELLNPPLPKEDAEGELAADQPASTPEPADEPGLLAIAKAAVSEGPGEDEKDIVRAGLKAAEIGRQSRPPAPPGRGQGRARHGRPSSAAGLQGHLPKSAGAVEAMHEAQARSELPARPKRDGEKVGPGAIVAGVMLALAAGVALYVGLHKSRTEPVAVTAHEAAQAAASPSPGSQGPGGNATAGRTDAPEKPHMLALDDLKPAEGSAKTTESAKVVVPSATSPMTLALKDKADLSGATSTRAAPKKGPSAANAQAAPEPEAVTLNDAERAAPAQQQEAKQAGASNEALPTHPSSGAIQGAIGSVMGGARSCIAGQETGSKATVTFGADGRVKSVVLAGPAAGTPAEGCIRSALMGARVPAFSEPEYSASFTVRPP